MSLNRGFLYAAFVGGFGLLASACGPTYPKCENDDHCADKGEYCLQGMCQQCRDNSHCGENYECSAGKCARPVGFCDDSTPCPGNQKCRDNRCGAECLDNSECGAGTFCKDGSCLTKPECGEGADNPACPEGSECLSGRCQVKVVQCSAEPVYFDFNRSNIKRNQRAALDQIAECLQQPNTADMTLAGHADERGTIEYNMALGQRRADEAQSYLTNKGVPPSKLRTTSYGEEQPAVNGSNESAWKKNRRTEFNPN